jgi:hypothetical protein
MDDIRSGDRRKIENAMNTFVALGERDIIPQLVRALEADGNVELAEAYLNCKQDELRRAARAWADKHGQQIIRLPAGDPHQPRWGQW